MKWTIKLYYLLALSILSTCCLQVQSRYKSKCHGHEPSELGYTVKDEMAIAPRINACLVYPTVAICVYYAAQSRWVDFKGSNCCNKVNLLCSRGFACWFKGACTEIADCPT